VSILDKIEEKGMEKGIEKGMEKGRQEERKIIARTLLKEGAEIALVIKATGLGKGTFCLPSIQR
jgi:predicted transposase/invertase (TIGR01784 family)